MARLRGPLRYRAAARPRARPGRRPPWMHDDWTPTREAHTVPAESVAGSLRTDPATGLTDAEAARRLERDGANELPRRAPDTTLRRVARQFTDLVIWLLIGAAIVSLVLREWVDAGAILAIVLINAALGALQEGRAARALESLRQLSAPRAKVLRGGVPRAIAARELVAGDHVILEAGDRVPADVRLIVTTQCSVDEATLTGESAPVAKDARAILPADTPMAERRNMAYSGSTVVAGQAEGLVVATGPRTELGAIAGLLREAAEEPTPLQRQLARLGRALIVICLVLVAVTCGTQLLRGTRPIDALFTAIALAVAAVPEGLPAVVTVALAIGVRRMASRNALIRRLPGVETLGCVTVICTDKTGTLTRGQMTVVQTVANDAADLRELLLVGERCNRATFGPQCEGDPTEVALLVAAAKAGLDVPAARAKPLAEAPFDSDRKRMSVLLPADAGSLVLYTKGAAEAVLPRCTMELRDGRAIPLTADRCHIHLADAERMASQALRVLAMARRELPHRRNHSAPLTTEEHDLTFVGLVGMIDPPRDEAAQSVAACQGAGIRAVMITGDHPATATAIAQAVGLLNNSVGESGCHGHVLMPVSSDLQEHGHEYMPMAPPEATSLVTGPELDAMPDIELARRAPTTTVYARTTAAHKLRIVRALKANGQVVAMTGDGVNDAPALKEADIGIAMGLASSDVTKDAADMVLTDDNFASIVAAVEEGRGIFANIRRFVHYLLACNAAEIIIMLFAALAGWPMPLGAVELLWINLVTDGLPALALGVDPPERGTLRRPPRPQSEPILPWSAAPRLILHAMLMAAVTLISFRLTLNASLATAQTVAFCTIAFAELAYAIAQRSHQSAGQRTLLRGHGRLLAAVAASAGLLLMVALVPALRPLFGLTALHASRWIGLTLLACAPALIVELANRWRAYRDDNA